MKKFMALGLVLCLLLGSGCAFFRRSALRLSEEDLKNAEVSRTIAKNCLKTWPLNSGFIRKALGSSIDKLPKEAVTAMDELDTLAAKKEELTDKEAGEVLGLKVIFAGSLVREAVKQYAPDILDLLPAVLP